MKIGIIGDIHWCQYSSIVRNRGEKYSLRIENCIKSINWAEAYLTERVDFVVYLGDFFDQSKLNAEEISALSDIIWLNDSYFIVGNHEMGLSNLEYSSAHIFNLLPDSTIVSEPKLMTLDTDTELCFLPYVLEEQRVELSKVFPKTDKKRIIVSHNDIAGIQMGSIISKSGYSLEDIDNNCDLFINGHIHNGTWVNKKVLNLGNLTGQNFSEDANTYEHHIAVLDTETLKVELIENPYAFNFYQLDFTFPHMNKPIDQLKSNSVISVKCKVNDVEEVKDIIKEINPLCSRLTVQYDVNEDSNDMSSQSLSLNHVQEFEKYVKQYIGNDELVLAELAEVLK